MNYMSNDNATTVLGAFANKIKNRTVSALANYSSLTKGCVIFMDGSFLYSSEHLYYSTQSNTGVYTISDYGEAQTTLVGFDPVVIYENSSYIARKVMAYVDVGGRLFAVPAQFSAFYDEFSGAWNVGLSMQSPVAERVEGFVQSPDSVERWFFRAGNLSSYPSGLANRIMVIEL